jgi:hypothetical protein
MLCPNLALSGNLAVIVVDATDWLGYTVYVPTPPVPEINPVIVVSGVTVTPVPLSFIPIVSDGLPTAVPVTVIVDPDIEAVTGTVNSIVSVNS